MEYSDDEYYNSLIEDLNVIKAFSDSLNTRIITTDLMIYNISEELYSLKLNSECFLFDSDEPPENRLIKLFQDFINTLCDLYEPFENIKFLDEKYNDALRAPYIILKDFNKFHDETSASKKNVVCYTIFKNVIESKFKPSHPLRQELGI